MSTTETSPASGIKPEALYSFSIERAALLAVQLFQSSDETRVALCCSKFEIKSARHLLLVATDGKRIACHESEIMPDSLLSGEIPQEDEFSVDLSGVKKMPRVKVTEGYSVSVFVFVKHVEFTCGKYTYRTPKVKVKFPEWRGVLPTGELIPTAEICLDGKLLLPFSKAAKLLTDGELIRLGLRGKSAIVEIQLPSDRAFRGVLMPVSTEEDKAKANAEAAKAAAEASPVESSPAIASPAATT